MKPTEDIAPLAEIVEAQYVVLEAQAYDALTALHGFWTRLYGPNEALTPAFDALESMGREWEGES